MLAARATARRNARLSRSFATAVESAGVKVAAVDHGQPTSSVTFVVKAGSRFESKPGVANFLKNFAYKATSSRSALGTVREAELYGGVLSTSLSREHLALTAEFLRGDEEFFVDVLSSFFTSSKFTPWELKENVTPTVAAETQAATSDAAIRAVELAHALAFRNGLGASIYAPTHPSVSIDDIKSFASQAFSKDSIAVLGTGISQETLEKLVGKSLGSLGNSSSVSTSVTKIHGGETRQGLHDAPQTVFLGFGTPGAPSAELAVLSAYLSPSPSVKWSKGTSPLSSIIPEGITANTLLLPYSDATLFGLLFQGESAEGVKEAVTASVKTLKDAAASIKPEDLKKAIAKAKFAAASIAENREGFVSTFGPRLLAGSELSLDGALSALEGTSASNVSKAASSFFKTDSTYVAVGDTNALPFKDELGL